VTTLGARTNWGLTMDNLTPRLAFRPGYKQDGQGWPSKYFPLPHLGRYHVGGTLPLGAGCGPRGSFYRMQRIGLRSCGKYIVLE
jgi:hypothetical protein